VDIYSLKEQLYQKEAYQYFLGINNITKEKVLVKTYSLKFLENYQNYYYKIINEMHLVEGIKSERILRPLSYLKTSNNMYVIYDYFPEKSIKYFIQNMEEEDLYPVGDLLDLAPPVLQRFRFLHEILLCISDLKYYQVLHRDLRPSNLLSNAFFYLLKLYKYFQFD
jgi:serine/threonine protein kinase